MRLFHPLQTSFLPSLGSSFIHVNNFFAPKAASHGERHRQAVNNMRDRAGGHRAAGHIDAKFTSAYSRNLLRWKRRNLLWWEWRNKLRRAMRNTLRRVRGYARGF